MAAPAPIFQDRQRVLRAVKSSPWAMQYLVPEQRADREVVLAAVEQNADAFQYAAPELRGNQEVVLEALKRDPRAWRFAAQELLADPHFKREAKEQGRAAALAMVRERGSDMKYAAPWCRADREVVLGALTKEPLAWIFAAQELLEDPDFRREARMQGRAATLRMVREQGSDLKYAAPWHENDRKVVLAAVHQNGLALQHAAPGLQADWHVVLEAVQQNGDAWQCAAPRLQTDRKFALAAVHRNGLALRCAALWLQADRKVVLAAVQQNGDALQYAAPELRAKPQVVLEALKQDPRAWRFAAQELRADPDFKRMVGKQDREGRAAALFRVRKRGIDLEYVDPWHQADPEVVLEALKKDLSAWHFAAPELLEDPDFKRRAQLQGRDAALDLVTGRGIDLGLLAPWHRADLKVVLTAVRRDGLALQHAAADLRGDLGVVLAAVKQNAAAWQFATQGREFAMRAAMQGAVVPGHNADEEIVFTAVKQKASAFSLADPTLKTSRNFVLLVVKSNGLALEHAAASLRDDSEVVLAAVKSNGLALKWAAPIFKANRDFVLAAVQSNGLALEHAVASLRADEGIVIAAVNQDGSALSFAATELEFDEDLQVLAGRRSDQAWFRYGHSFELLKSYIAARGEDAAPVFSVSFLSCNESGGETNIEFEASSLSGTTLSCHLAGPNPKVNDLARKIVEDCNREARSQVGPLRRVFVNIVDNDGESILVVRPRFYNRLLADFMRQHQGRVL